MASKDNDEIAGANSLTENKKELIELTSNSTSTGITTELMKKIQVREFSNISSNQSSEVQCNIKNNLTVEKCDNEMTNIEEFEYINNVKKQITVNQQYGSRVLIDNSKNNNTELKEESIGSDIEEGNNRKRKSTDNECEKKLSSDDECAKTKRLKNSSDNYCWRCHKDSVEVYCVACPRSWHRKCLGGVIPTSPSQTWLCGECASILQAENVETRPPIMSHLSVDQLCMVFRYMIERMRNCPGSEPFLHAVDLEDVPNYLDYVIKPMDLTLLEKNVNSKCYGSTDGFLADTKWIQHNCIVFNTCGGVYADTSKLSNASKQIIKTARQEVSEFEACPDCYTRGRNLPRPNSSWFIEACRQPHPLIWAKLKGFPFWPAKALPRMNTQGHIDVRFFGEHDRAWVGLKDIFLYSRDPPTLLPRKKKIEMVECIKEITRHCKKLELTFGPFTFAPPRTPFNPQDPTQIKLLLPEYDPLRQYDFKMPLYYNSLSFLERNESSVKQTTVASNEPATSNQSLTNEHTNNTEWNSDGKINDTKKSQTTIQVNAMQHQENDGSTLTDKISIKTGTQEKPSQSVLKANKSIKKVDSSPQKISSKRIYGKKNQNNVDKVVSNAKNVKLKTKQNSKKNLTDMNVLSPPENEKISKPTVTRVYKPKTKIVDEFSIEGQHSNIEKVIKKPSTIVELTNNKQSVNNASEITSNISCFLTTIKESSPTRSSTLSGDSNKPESLREQIQQILSNSRNNSLLGKRPNKARKSFPNKPPPAPNQISLKTNIESFNSVIDIPDTNNDKEANYQLPPPEAGPLSAQLNKGANELVRQMARLIEDTLKEAAESTTSNLGDSVETHEATIYALRLQIERMRWQHQQQITELKFNADRTMREMKASMEVERIRALEEIRKEAEDEKTQYILEIKSKQWCSWCHNEAFYYCCWNTAYCSKTCQQSHWKTHMNSCTHKVDVNSIEINTQQNHPQQSIHREQLHIMPTLLMNAQ